MKKLITAAGLLLALAAGAQQVMQIRNPLDKAECATVVGAGMEWRQCIDGNVAQQLPISIVTPPTTPPTPTPTEPPKTTTPAEVKGNTVTLGQSVTTAVGNYPSIAFGPYRAVNNVWGAGGLSGWQAVGMQPGGAGVDVRLSWRWPTTSKEVIAYPEVAYGRSASFAKEASAKLPMRVGDLKQLTTSYARIDGTDSARGEGHVTYDLWTSNNPNALARGNRLAEIMLPEVPFGGYGVPNWGPAYAGRAGQGGTGRSATGYQGRHNIGGNEYDVYFNPKGGALAWAFIVFEPVNFGQPGAGKKRDWMPIISFMRGKGWIGADDFMNVVELGVEPVGNGKATSGDITIRNFQVEVQ